jgi:hypothetical protein
VVCRHLTAQSSKPMALRQSGTLESGRRVHINTADMRRSVWLQFYPDCYEWAERHAVLISGGYSSHQARGSGAQSAAVEGGPLGCPGPGDRSNSIALGFLCIVYHASQMMHCFLFKGWGARIKLGPGAWIGFRV